MEGPDVDATFCLGLAGSKGRGEGVELSSAGSGASSTVLASNLAFYRQSWHCVLDIKKSVRLSSQYWDRRLVERSREGARMKER